jgi:hypothetical protein
MKQLFRCFDPAGGCTDDRSRASENIYTICWDNGAKVVSTVTSDNLPTGDQTGTTTRINSRGKVCVEGTYTTVPLPLPMFIEDTYARKGKRWVVRRTPLEDPALVVTCPSGRTETYLHETINGKGRPRCDGFPNQPCRQGVCP